MRFLPVVAAAAVAAAPARSKRLDLNRQNHRARKFATIVEAGGTVRRLLRAQIDPHLVAAALAGHW